MLNNLRIPILAVVSSVLLLGGALYLRFSDDASDTSTPVPEAVSVEDATDNTPDNADVTDETPVPTLQPTPLPVSNISPPVPGQLTEGLIGNINRK